MENPPTPKPPQGVPQADPSPGRGRMGGGLRAVFTQLRFRTKFMAVGLLVAAPLSALTGYAASQFHSQVQQAQARLQALDLAGASARVMFSLATHRGLSARVFAGGEELSSELVAQQAQVTTDMRALEAALAGQSVATLSAADTQGLVSHLRHEVQALLRLPEGQDPTRNFERHNALNDSLMALTHRAGSRAATAQPWTLPSAYDAAFVALPALQEALARQRGWGSAVLQKEEFEPEAVAQHLLYAGASAQRLSMLRTDTQTLKEVTLLLPAQNGLQQLDEALTEAEVFLQRSMVQVMARKGGAVIASNHFAEGTSALRFLDGVTHSLSTQVRALTQADLDQARHWRLATLLFLFGLLALLAVVYREFERSTVGRLEYLQQASGRLASGDFEHRVASEGSDEIADLATALDSMRKRLREAVANHALALAARESERKRTDFLARWSHDLRTPLAAVLGFARLLGEREGSQLTAVQQADVQRIQTAAEHLLHLVNDVLAVTSEELREVVLRNERVDVAAVVCDAIDLTAHDAAAQKVEVLLTEPPERMLAQADRARLLQVLGNLVGNAIKFNRPQGWVRIALAQDEHRVCIEVTDNGPGIAPELLPRLFKPFERLDAGQRGIKGTGLGLATVKRLVQAMEGDIGVQSSPNAGCQFTVWLPRHVAARGAGSPAHPSAQKPVLSGRVAYVEDNETNTVLMQVVLETRTQIELRVFATGQAALQSTEAFDLWIIDRQLPDTDGLSLLQALEAARGVRQRAVMLSAEALPAHREQALSAGFVDYWTKPISPDRLEAGLRQQLSQVKALPVGTSQA